MVCKHCQKRIRKDAQVCPHCNTPQNETVKLGAMSGTRKKKAGKALTKKQKMVGLITAAVALLLIGGGALLWLVFAPKDVDTTEWYPRLGKTISWALIVLGGALLATGFSVLRRAWVQIISMVMSAILLVFGSFAMYVSIYWRDIALGEINENINQGPSVNEEDVGANSTLPDTVVNIALFGLDNRSESGDNGRSDAITVLSVDRKHNKIKLSSIARDTLVTVDGYRWTKIKDENYQWSTDANENYEVLMNARKNYWTKITHAFAYGAQFSKEQQKEDTSKSGPGAAVKALNENFGLNITKYVYVNFHEFTKIIDLVGGVEIEIEQRELSKLNEHIRGMNKKGMNIQELTSAGKKNLSGGQALAYARLRKTDTDIKRGNRQKAVIDGVLAKAKKMSVLDYPELIRKALSICNTNLTGEEILELAEWMINKNPKTVNFSLPDDECRKYSWDSYQSQNSNAFKSYGSVYIMDLNYASAVLRDFIYETDEASLLTPNRLTWPEVPEELKARLRNLAEKKAEEAKKKAAEN